MNETTAIALATAGDQSAFAWIVRQYQHMVFTVVMRILRDREDAEEVSQDVFVKAFQNLGSFQGSARFSTWLYSIAYRTAISQLRRKKDRTVNLEDPVARMAGNWDANAMEMGDRKAALERALGGLSPEDAAVMTFFYMEEMSVEEIVTATGLSASNVKVKLHRSRKRMMELLQEQLKEETWTLAND